MRMEAGSTKENLGNGNGRNPQIAQISQMYWAGGRNEGTH